MIVMMLLIILMTISIPVTATNFENIEVTEEGNLVLTPQQYTQIARDLVEKDVLEAKLTQAEKELDRAYEKGWSRQRIDDHIRGAAAATLLIFILQ